MKKLIRKTILFVLPFIFFFCLNIFFYNPKEGDLVRLGYLYSNPAPRSLITNQYKLTKQYTLLSETSLDQINKFNVITIGDSFSEQDSLCYKNYIANYGLKVLHIDRFISGENPTQTLVKLLNSDEFFNHVRTDYIVLQIVERRFNIRNNNIDFNLSINLDSISKQISGHKKSTRNYDFQFFSDLTIKAPINNFLYNFKPKPIFAKTYKYKSKSSALFSNAPDELLFYQNDINLLKSKNDSLKIIRSIEVLEQINEKVKEHNIKLIVLVSPDKYDLYFEYIKNNELLTNPVFFRIYNQTQKDFINIDSYKVLKEKIKSESDIYFYDDTHWSPKGAQIIADEIIKKIRTHSSVDKKM